MELSGNYRFFQDSWLQVFQKYDVTAIPFFKYELFGIVAFSRYIFTFLDNDYFPDDGHYWLGIFERED